MNIIRRSAQLKADVGLATPYRGGIYWRWISESVDDLHREIAPVALIVPLSCLDGGMRQVVEAYRAGLAALEGSKP